MSSTAEGAGCTVGTQTGLFSLWNVSGTGEWMNQILNNHISKKILLAQ